MNANTLKIAGIGVMYLVVIVCGFLVSRSGKPFPVLIFAIHKLVSIAVVVLLIRTIYQVNQVTPLTAAQVIVVVITGVLFLATAVTGGLLSVEKPMPAIVQAMHQIAPFLTVISSAAMLILLLRR